MGYLVNGQCVSTSAQAIDIHYSAIPESLTAGSTSYLSRFIKVSGGWNYQRIVYNSSGTITSSYSVNVALPTFPTCDESARFMDGMTIGWGIAAAMVGAWAVKLLIQQMR